MFDDTPVNRWRAKNFGLGKCITCGKDKGSSPYLRICTACANRHKKRRRKTNGSVAWVAGSPGRPPLYAVARKEKAEFLGRRPGLSNRKDPPTIL